MQRRKRKSAVILSWILGFAFLLSGLSIPAGNAKAAMPTEEQYPIASYETQTYTTTSGYNFAKLLQESLYLYDANMCGTDVATNSGFTWRTNCHTGDAKITYNGKTVDLSGGYHDAGDHAKFGLPQAYSASVLGLAYYQFKDAFKQTGSEDHYIRIIDRFIEYFEKCTILDSKGNVTAFCYQVGSGNDDHKYWGAPENQAQRTRAWFTSASTPATDIVCETAAALAIYYCNFKDSKPAEAKTALSYAEKLFTYANNNKKAVAVIETDNATGNPFYKSTSWEDDYALAAAWLYKATGKANYKTNYTNVFGSRNYCGWVLSWDDVSAAALLYGPNASTTASYVSSYINTAKNNTKDNGKYVFLTNWGSARYNASLQFMGLAYDGIKSTNTYGEWAEGQMNYLLGSNPGNHCFVVGYNTKSVKYPHHRAASGYLDVSSNATTPLKHVLVGALVGGPDSDSSSYRDSATNYATNEVALDYNAGLVGAAAGLYLYEMKYGTSGEKAAQTVVDETKLTSEMRTSVVSSKLSTPTVSTPTNTASGVKVSWSKVSGATGYKVYRKVSGGSWSCIATITSGSAVSTTDKTAVSGTTYYYTVRATRDSELSSYDKTGKSIKYLKQPTPSVKNAATGVKISWTKSDGAAGYYVYRKVPGGSWSRIKTITNVNTLTYTDTKAVSGTSYVYTVKSYSGSTVSSYDTTGKTIKYLARPTVSVANTSTGVKLSWSKSTGATGYYVYRKTPSASGWTKVATVSNVNTLTYTDTKATSGNTYLYTVKAYNGSTNSAFISGKKIVRLPQPSLNSVSNVSNGVKLSWSKSTGATGYYVYRKVSGGKWSKIATVSGVNTLTYTDTKASSGTKYIYTVKAYNGSSVSSYNTSGKSLTYLSQPTVSVSNASSGVKVNWSKSTGASGYYVYRKTPSASGWTKVATISNVNTLTYTDTKVTNGNTYLYTVKAYKSTTYSAYDSGKSIKYQNGGPAYYTIDLGNGKATTVYGYYDTAVADEIISQLNAHRKNNGLNTLTKTDALTKAANARAYEITYLVEHTRPNGDTCFSVSDKVYAENIAAGYPSADAVMSAWKGSSGHNANMLRDGYKTVGVSVFVAQSGDKEGYKVYYVQHFGY